MSNINELFETNIKLSRFEPYKIKCEKCCGLCCVALYFSKIGGFPEDKNSGIACKNLQNDYKCKIHSKLSANGLKGCMAYDCFGAGQQITRLLSKKPKWRTISAEDNDMIFKAFMTVMQLHHTLWYLTEATILHLPKAEKELLELLLIEGKELTEQPIEVLQNLDIIPFREKANKFLKGICQAVVEGQSDNGETMQSSDYMGKSMKHENLIGKDFSMSLLIAADLEQANLYGANFLGADMRDTNIKNTDLSHCIFLTQMQINSARGNRNTILPTYLYKPLTWEV